ncbi:MAG: FtsQ-type POTRA domain-containing protein [Methylomarinum sp.]|nr:FtsQ-type POTRA domain-containing protein [Methylococcales bacterium]NOR70462.1 FtsQ-type POTRA domain-containing protein [Methylomarinum sp.]
MDKKTIHYFLLGCLVLITGWFGWLQVKTQGVNWLPVKYVRIEGAFQYIAKEKIKQVLKGQVNNGLYNADIQQIKASVNQLPWVESVHVKRVWPDAIDIQIVEQVPVVRWGETGLLNKEGEKFIPNNVALFGQLPMLFGPIGKEQELLEVMKGLIIAMNDKQMALAEFRVSERRAWYLKLRNNMVIKLGRNEPLKKFQRFLQTFALIGEEQITKVAVVDLRYPNGYALAWKQNKAVIDWKKIAEMNKI